MTDLDARRQVVRDLVDAVWMRHDLGALARYWTPDCVNHAAPAGQDVGLDALRGYHERFLAQLGAFSDIAIDVVRQVAEDDTVVT